MKTESTDIVTPRFHLQTTILMFYHFLLLKKSRAEEQIPGASEHHHYHRHHHHHFRAPVVMLKLLPSGKCSDTPHKYKVAGRRFSLIQNMKPFRFPLIL